MGQSGTYHSPRRAEQAAATRTAIIEAAARLFAERGYAATTMAAIAQEARVAVKSVYTLADKARLMLLAVDRAIAGDDEPVAMADRPRVREIVESTDPAEQARAAARLGAETLLRLYPIYRAFEQAAATDAELRAHWREYQTRRYADTARVVAALPALRPGLTRERATETIWALLTWHPVALLVEERGWTQEHLTEWLEDLLTTLVR
jgi:AcrR family transcriptional regulator